jgi:DNA-binding Lrp family transcriptional regulator
MDAIDRKIVALLQEDASLSLAQIAHRVGLSQSPCWKRIQRLEKADVILKRVALISPDRSVGLRCSVSIETGDAPGVAGEVRPPSPPCQVWNSTAWPATSTACCAWRCRMQA